MEIIICMRAMVSMQSMQLPRSRDIDRSRSLQNVWHDFVNRVCSASTYHFDVSHIRFAFANIQFYCLHSQSAQNSVWNNEMWNNETQSKHELTLKFELISFFLIVSSFSCTDCRNCWFCVVNSFTLIACRPLLSGGSDLIGNALSISLSLGFSSANRRLE